MLLGCSCRDVHAHPACVATFASTRGREAWRTCMTCKRRYTAEMHRALAEAWHERAVRRAAQCAYDLALASAHLADARRHAGLLDEALAVERACLETVASTHGRDHACCAYMARRIEVATLACGTAEATEALLRRVRATASAPRATLIDAQIARCLVSRGLFSEALALLRGTEPSPERAFDVAVCEFEIERGEATLDRVTSACAAVVAALGARAGPSVECSLVLARCLDEMGRHADADEVLARLYEEHVTRAASLEWAICVMGGKLESLLRRRATPVAVDATVRELRPLLSVASCGWTARLSGLLEAAERHVRPP
jgi:hypothetical protein